LAQVPQCKGERRNNLAMGTTKAVFPDSMLACGARLFLLGSGSSPLEHLAPETVSASSIAQGASRVQFQKSHYGQTEPRTGRFAALLAGAACALVVSSRRPQGGLACRRSRTSNPTPLSAQDVAATLPTLTAADVKELQGGALLQRQTREGLSGSGWAAIEFEAPADAIFRHLRDFRGYPKMIPSVRRARVTQMRAHRRGFRAHVNYVISKFHLHFSVIHNVDDDAKVIQIALDPDQPAACVLKQVAGYWHVQALSSGRCRVWLHIVSLRASRLIPPCLLDYAAERALRRATSWLSPFFTPKCKKVALSRAVPAYA